MKKSQNPETFTGLKNQKYGEPETLERAEFQSKTKAFKIGQLVRKLREEAGLTQHELAMRIGTQRSYICKIEKGSDMNVSTMFKIFDHGLGQSARLLIGQVLE